MTEKIFEIIVVAIIMIIFMVGSYQTGKTKGWHEGWEKGRAAKNKHIAKIDDALRKKGIALDMAKSRIRKALTQVQGSAGKKYSDADMKVIERIREELEEE